MLSRGGTQGDGKWKYGNQERMMVHLEVVLAALQGLHEAVRHHVPPHRGPHHRLQWAIGSGQ